MTIEDELKNLILEKYGSIKYFSEKAGLKYTTVDTIFRRGIMNSGVQNIIAMCHELGISTDELADGRIVYVENIPNKADKELKDLICDFAINVNNYNILNNGKPIPKEKINTLVAYVKSMSAMIENMENQDE